MPKYIVVLGTIMSGLGKGILTASLSKILRKRGFNVAVMKFDGYLNYDCGTMNPFRHGEVFVLEDGSEVDMDFGTYERFLGINLKGDASLTGGKVFKTIIDKERRGDYLGLDVQFIPHVTDYIKNYIKKYAEKNNADICMVEVGGTVGDIENSYFIEAVRQLSLEEEVLFIQLTYIPEIYKGEQKTKPTQQANRLLRSLGIFPKIIVARAENELTNEAKKKIALYSNIEEKNVFSDPNVGVIYELPLVLENQGIYDVLSSILNIEKREVDWTDWERRINNLKNAKTEKTIGIVGKYVNVKDAYVSIYEALYHSGAELGIKPNIKLIDAESIEKEGVDTLKGLDGIIIPGGFGKRGIEGKIKAIEFARTNKMPLLGLCLGMQLMVVEFARNVLGWKDAHSTEFEKTKHAVIDLLPEQRQIAYKGGTMRLGAYPMHIKKGTKLYEAYKKEVVYERHRHRYEVNPAYVDDLEKAGLVISATYKGIVEAVEYKDSFAIGTQCHPELSSKFEKPNPIFKYFLSSL